MPKTKGLLSNQIVYDGNVFTRDKKSGYYLSAKPIYKSKRIMLHRYVWIKYNGDIPDGMSVHHIDGDKENNSIDNYILMSKSKHTKHHIDEIMENQLDERRERFIEHALPAAAEWHKSEEGRKWHKGHWHNSLKPVIEEKVEKTCVVCDSKYETPKFMTEKSMFCSKKCKAKHRRDSGVDDIEKSCVVCGNTFMDSKYANKRTCSSPCKTKLFLYSRDGIEWEGFNEAIKNKINNSNR